MDLVHLMGDAKVIPMLMGCHRQSERHQSHFVDLDPFDQGVKMCIDLCTCNLFHSCKSLSLK